MKVCVIGAGSIGRRHLVNLRILGHEPIVIDTSGKVREWARAEGYRVSTDHYGIAGDAAIIATPANCHCEWLRYCIEWKVPVLVEKPLGVIEDLPVLRELRSTKPVMVGYQLRFHPEVQRIRPLLSKAAAGILTCWCDSRTWPGSAAAGDFVGEFSHEIDLCLHLQPDARVSSVSSHDYDLGLSLGNYKISLSARSDIYLRRWEIFDQPYGSYDVQFHSSEELGDQMYIDELAHFLRVVEGGPIAPGCTLDEGIAVLDVVRQMKGAA